MDKGDDDDDDEKEERSEHGDIMDMEEEKGDFYDNFDEAESEFVEETILKLHAHCTPDVCWRQKYTESLGQLRCVLEQLKNELEEKTADQMTEPHLKRQSKVQLIEQVCISSYTFDDYYYLFL